MDPINVLLTLPFSASQVEKLENVSPRLSISAYEAKNAEDLAGVMDGVDVLYALRVLPRPQDAPGLRWVQLHSAGIDHALHEALYTGGDVTFTTASGIHTVNVAEYVMAQILAVAHRLPRMFEDKAAAHWTEDRQTRYLPHELRGATLGVVGYGSIGREVARLGQGFGMSVLAVKRNLRQLADDGYCLPGTGDPEAEIPERLYPIQALHSFLGECDYVVLTLPLTEATYHLIDAAALAAMKPTAVLINISRGDIVDEKALVAALEKGTLGGAALDVFNTEPLPPDSPLWKLPNVLISPHISGFTPRYNERAADLFAENLRRYVVGEPLLNVVDQDRNY
jgi:phosphoglycerate dehydrogenase-like enzyme